MSTIESTFILNGRLPSLNEYINNQRANRFKGADDKKKYERWIMSEIKAQGMPRFTEPVEIIIKWVERDNRRDLDNIQWAIKLINDSLVKSKVLIDDSRKYVKRITHEVVTEKYHPRIEVTVKLIEGGDNGKT